MKTELQNVPTVHGNEAELREMLFNVVFNAIDAIPQQGHDHLPHLVNGRWMRSCT